MQLTTCSKPAIHNLLQVCSSQLAASLQFTVCSKSAVHNLQQVCSSQFAASLQFTICSKSAVRNLQQVCSSQLAASLLTTCSRLVVIKPEQAMRTHPDIGLMIATCSKSAADLLQLARFWLCRIWGIIKAEVCVICRSRRLRQIRQTEAFIILHILQEQNSIIVLLFICICEPFPWRSHLYFEFWHKQHKPFVFCIWHKQHKLVWRHKVV